MADTRDFLLEIGVEEMPSAPLIHASSQFRTLIERGLDDAGLSHGDVRVISSPRRLAAVVDGVAAATDEVHEVKRGPATNIAFDEDGRPSKAACGFARKCGVDARDLIRRVDEDGREYVFAERTVPAAPAEPLLSKLSEAAIASIEWPNYRSQRWGAERATFVRPVRWICALFGTDVLDVRFADVVSGSTTRGHRVLSPGEHEVGSPSEYERVLESAHVLSAERRADEIRAGIERVERELDVRVDTPKKVFDEVVNLCEWPTVLVGTFDEEFLAVPHEIICESMLSNQRYFPCYDADGGLTRNFVLVSNGNPAVSDTVIAGNESVVRARLYDAKFFYEEDLKIPLETFRERLAKVGFQKKLGSVLQKSDRMEDIALAIAHTAHVGAQAASDAQRAAHLAKADLVSSAVIEFTSQQGVMGAYYAEAAGETPGVAAAIRDHYRPRFAGDDLPEGIAGCIVAVADKIDTIAGMFAIDEPPTGSKDPFALRRSAIGVLNILRHRLQCAYEPIVDAALDVLTEQGISFDRESVRAAVCAFLKGRMEQIAREAGISGDVVSAVSAGKVTDPAGYMELCAAVQSARSEGGSSFEDLATAFARASHLSDASLGVEVDEGLFTPSELKLHEAVTATRCVVSRALDSRDFPAAISALASLRAPIDCFFDDVLVMDEDERIRCNRLRLLNEFTSVFSDVADISELAGA